MATQTEDREGQFQVETPQPSPAPEGHDGAADGESNAELKARLAKAESDVKAFKARRQPYEELRQDIANLKAELTDDRIARSEADKALVKALSTGDTDSLPQELERIEGERKQRTGLKQWETFRKSMADSFEDALAGVPGVSVEVDGNGIHRVSVQEAPDDSKDAISQAVNAYTEAERGRDGEAMGLALAHVHRVSLRLLREGHAVAVEEARKEGQRRRQAEDSVEMGGRGRTGTGASDDEVVRQYARDGKWSPRVAEAMKKQGLL